MGQISAAIAGNIATVIGLGELLCKDIPGDRFARLAVADGEPIISNHPGFVIGHMSMYPAYCVEAITGNTGSAAYPDSYEELFVKGAECRDDNKGLIYPNKDDLLTVFAATHKAAAEAIADMDDARLTAPNPIERLVERFPTLGSILVFFMQGHAMMHLGQLSAWRRMERMGSAF